MPIIPKYKNWQDFKLRNDLLSNKQKGDRFEVFTKFCLETHPTYKTQLKHVWLLKNVPANVQKYLKLPKDDEGIDLIAETKEGTYWAIQCKYKSDETTSVTLKELSTFTSLAFAKCKNIKLGLVCTNTDRRSSKLKGYEGKLQFCTGEFWRSLDKDFFKILYQYMQGKVVLPKAKKPRKHQQRAIENAHKHFAKKRNARGKLIMPCGTGKSLAAFWIAEKLKSKKILIAVPSLALIRQTLEVWTKESIANKKNLNWITVCSDESVGNIERDDFVVLTQDLGVPVHTDSKEIAFWLKKPKTGLSVVFTTYQSGKVIAKAAKKEKIDFDLGIMDEAHKTVGKGETLFSHLLYEKNIKIKKRIFMTATERRYQGQSDKILTMEDPRVYGETFELLTFKEALAALEEVASQYAESDLFRNWENRSYGAANISYRKLTNRIEEEEESCVAWKALANQGANKLVVQIASHLDSTEEQGDAASQLASLKKAELLLEKILIEYPESTVAIEHSQSGCFGSICGGEISAQIQNIEKDQAKILEEENRKLREIDNDFSSARLQCIKGIDESQQNRKIEVFNKCLKQLKVLIKKHRDSVLATSILSGEPFLREIEWKEKTYSGQGIAGQYAVEGFINGKELSLWIVPDQENIVIPPELVEHLNVQRGVKIKIGADDNATIYYSAQLESILVGDFIVENIFALIAPFDEVTDVYVGRSFLEHVSWVESGNTITLKKEIETDRVIKDINLETLENSVDTLLSQSKTSALDLISEADKFRQQAVAIKDIERFNSRLPLLQQAEELLDQAVEEHPHIQTDIARSVRSMRNKLAMLKRITVAEYEKAAKVQCDLSLSYIDKARKAYRLDEMEINLRTAAAGQERLLESFGETELAARVKDGEMRCGLTPDELDLELGAIDEYAWAVGCAASGNEAKQHDRRIRFYQCVLNSFESIQTELEKSMLAGRVKKGDEIEGISKEKIALAIQNENDAKRLFENVEDLIDQARDVPQFFKRIDFMTEALQKIREIESLQSTVSVGELTELRKHIDEIRTDAEKRMPFEPELVTLTGSCFLMGSAESEKFAANDERQHEICIDDYEIGRYEITFKEYDRFVFAVGGDYLDDHDWGRDNYPVINVSWDDAVQYAKWLSEQTGETYRLPTEVEWEYACRGERGGRFFFDGEEDAADGYIRHAGNSPEGLPAIETRRANEHGLFDTLGTVWEWTSSRYAPYPVEPGDGRDGVDSPGPRVLRGGSYLTPIQEIGCGVRRAEARDYAAPDVGFRIVRTL